MSDHGSRDPDALLTSKSAAHRLGFSESTFRQMRSRGVGPAYFRVCGRVRYLPAAIDYWLEQHLVVPGSEAAK
jgi:predicted DNA-binding transcriptional regulator AlpA